VYSLNNCLTIHSLSPLLSIDVAILGSGPAACALAILLRQAGVSLATFSLPPRPSQDTAEIPETLPPATRLPITSQSLRPHYAMAISWTTPSLGIRHSIADPLGNGFFVHRPTFDQEMLAQVSVVHAQLTSLLKHPTGWTLEFNNHAPVRAGMVVDASGRSAALARLIGAPRIALDPLVALTVHASPQDFPAGEALVESAEDGWWFSALTPAGNLSLTWFAYQDRIPFAEALRATIHTSQRVKRLSPLPPTSRSARTEWLKSPAGPGWLAIGDAAFASDPLGSQGLWRAFESAHAAADLILHGSLRTYLDFYSAHVEHFLRERDLYYCLELRWPHSPFWRLVQSVTARM